MKQRMVFMQILAAASLAVGAMSSADAAIFFRTRVVVAAPAVVAPVAVTPVAVAPVVAAPVVTAPVIATPVAPVVAAPVVAAPVVAAPVVAAPVAVAPVYVPTCRLVAVPFVNALTGVTYSVTRRVCN